MQSENALENCYPNSPPKFPVRESRANQRGGTKRAGSKFIVGMSLILRRLIPVVKMSKPPTMPISVINPLLIYGAKIFASRKMPPCQQNSTTAASAMPMPNVAASTIEETKSRVALVSRNVSSW